MTWLVRSAVMLCTHLLEQMGLPTRGRRCQLGSLHGPMNHESINGTHPAMLAAQRCNSYVQLPYCFPSIKESHFCRHCKCMLNKDTVMVEAMQMAQDAQAGYACDYCTKRQPMAFNEVKECCKGHITLAESIHQGPLQRQGKRHATRIMNDACGKGIARGQVENTHLRAYSKDSDVTSAESIKTCLTVSFFGSNYVDVIQRLNDRVLVERNSILAEVDMRSAKYKKVTFRDVATLCGERPRDERVLYLSPYEFITDWEVKMLSYPRI